MVIRGSLVVIVGSLVVLFRGHRLHSKIIGSLLQDSRGDLVAAGRLIIFSR